MAPQQGTSSNDLSLEERIIGKNINSRTYLATDYLNHFSEVIMTLEMGADMPDLVDDLESWQPKSYQEHFTTSGLSDADLFIEAYENSPGRYREVFDLAVKGLIADIRDLLVEALALRDEGDDVAMQRLIQRTCPQLHTDAEQISAIINSGGDDGHNQDEIDALMADFD